MASDLLEDPKNGSDAGIKNRRVKSPAGNMIPINEIRES
jgi:hypothetical protein